MQRPCPSATKQTDTIKATLIMTILDGVADSPVYITYNYNSYSSTSAGCTEREMFHTQQPHHLEQSLRSTRLITPPTRPCNPNKHRRSGWSGVHAGDPHISLLWYYPNESVS